VVSVDSFRPEIQTFLDSVFLTDACMIYAAVIHAASRQKQNLDSYVTKSRERRPVSGTSSVCHKSLTRNSS
jgi:hypothetical protein